MPSRETEKRAGLLLVGEDMDKRSHSDAYKAPDLAAELVKYP